MKLLTIICLLIAIISCKETTSETLFPENSTPQGNWRLRGSEEMLIRNDTIFNNFSEAKSDLIPPYSLTFDDNTVQWDDKTYPFKWENNELVINKDGTPIQFTVQMEEDKKLTLEASKSSILPLLNGIDASFKLTYVSFEEAKKQFMPEGLYRPVAIKYISPNADNFKVHRFTYNDEGVVIRQDEYSSDGTNERLLISRRYTFDFSKISKSKIYYRVDGFLDEAPVLYGKSGSMDLKFRHLGNSVITGNNKNGPTIESYTYDHAGRLETFTTTQYPMGTTKSSYTKYIYKYDGENKVVSREEESFDAYSNVSSNATVPFIYTDLVNTTYIPYIYNTGVGPKNRYLSNGEYNSKGQLVTPLEYELDDKNRVISKKVYYANHQLLRTEIYEYE
jgi:hypothetical protein